MDYYLMLQGTVYGPYTLPQMKSLSLMADTPIHLSVWPNDKWVYASDLPELRDCISDLQATAGSTSSINMVTNVVQVVVPQSQPSNIAPAPVSDTSNYAPSAPQNRGNAGDITPRSIGLGIFFSIITLGIYFLYWFCAITNETNRLAGEKYATGGFASLILGIITFGIYYLFWSYKMGEKTDIIKNNPNGSSKVAFLVLTLFGLNFVTVLMAQDAVNKAVSR